MMKRLGYIIVLVLCCTPNVVFAQNNPKGECDMPSKTCLTWVNKVLGNVKPHSLQWYNLKLLQLDSLITIKEFKTLKQELNSLDKDLEHPPMFLTQLNIHRAKLLLLDGDEAQAKILLTMAKNDLEQLNQSYFSPMRMITIANLMQNLNQHAEALVLLKRMEQTFETSKDSYLKLELYGNLGHAHRLLKNHDQALGYYQKSLQFAIELGGEQQISVLHEHVANAYLATNRPKLAETNFINALTYAEKDARIATITAAKITLAFFYLQQQKLQKVRLLIQDIDPAKIQPHQRQRWEAILGALSPNNN